MPNQISAADSNALALDWNRE